MKHTGDLREQTCWAKCVKLFFSGLNQTSQPAASPLKLLFTKPAEQCFSLTTNQPEQYFSAKFQTSERSHKMDGDAAPITEENKIQGANHARVVTRMTRTGGTIV